MKWRVLGLVVLLSACAAQPKVETRPAGPADQLLVWAEKLEDEGSWQQAIVQIERTLRLDPNNAQAWYQLARVYFRKGEFQKARQFSLRSSSFARGDQSLLEKNRQLMEQIELASTH